jgi:hypothetical protein
MGNGLLVKARILPDGTEIAGNGDWLCQGNLSTMETAMKLKTLLAVAIAGGLAAGSNGLILAQGTGGTTESPSANQPRGNPPAGAPAGSQQDPGAVSGTDRSSARLGAADFARLDKNGDGYISRDEAKDSDALSGRFSELDRDNDGRISRSEWQGGMESSSGSTGMGSTGMGSTTGSGASTGIGSSSSGTGASSGTMKEPK